ncbi:mitochondrial amidoxime reducing component 2-like [Odontomachus brunneus]|uniref:mitochondrial amidoxime reducing component 2-like n=1 Tax=Odontomachus brunneus TaxID=486640 RepID=UPI0013F1BA84|nr:mitochondrial amidoxime reducing component 2-like [Odontomachus brunneus]XP_032689269.1 mitochondrial amidoxime reducing component 2-like [Odontomachus brunneus]
MLSKMLHKMSNGCEGENMWSEIGEVSNLHVYPLSSCKPMDVSEIHIGHNGVVLDESIWNNMLVVYNADSKCIYNNSAAKLSHIIVKIITSRQMELSISDFKFKLDLDILNKNELHSVVCIQLVDSKYIVKKKYIDCGDVVANWLSHYLDEFNVRLGYVDLSAPKEIIQNYIEWMYDDSSSNQNLLNPSSCRLMSLESFEKMKENINNIDMKNFNPNIIITTKQPFKEDQIELFKIGDVVIKTRRLCLKFEGKKALHIPMEMRMQFLSLNCETIKSGKIKTGDKVYAILKKEKFKGPSSYEINGFVSKKYAAARKNELTKK